MNGSHCVLWVDHEKARLVFLDQRDASPVEITASNGRGNGNIHHKAGSLGPGKSTLDRHLAEEIERQLKRCREFVVVGPGPAKLEFIRHVHRNARDLDEKMVGVETMDHATDAQLVEFGRSYFRKFDRMHSSNEEVLAGLAAHRQPNL